LWEGFGEDQAEVIDVEVDDVSRDEDDCAMCALRNAFLNAFQTNLTQPSVCLSLPIPAAFKSPSLAESIPLLISQYVDKRFQIEIHTITAVRVGYFEGGRETRTCDGVCYMFVGAPIV
jgi:hypothetical protein